MKHNVLCPDCGDASGSVDWSECRLVAGRGPIEEPQVYIAFECLGCGALFDGLYSLTGDTYHLTDRGQKSDDPTAATLARIQRLGGAL